MKHIFAEKSFEHLAKSSMHGWLQQNFDNNNHIADRSYALPLVNIKRQIWAYERKIFGPKNPDNGQSISPTSLPSGIWMGSPKIKIENDFLDAIAQAQKLLPDFIKLLFRESNLQIKLGHVMADINPVYRRQQCRGQECVVNNVAGCFEIDQNAICLTQGYIHSDSRQFTRSSYLQVRHTSLHEFGHALEKIIFLDNGAVDELNTAAVHYRDFVKAYRKDVAKLNGQTCTSLGSSLAYYLTTENGGSHYQESHAVSELFAELFADMWENSFLSKRSVFPNAYAVFKRIIDSLELLVEKQPNINALTNENIFVFDRNSSYLQNNIRTPEL